MLVVCWFAISIGSRVHVHLRVVYTCAQRLIPGAAISFVVYVFGIPCVLACCLYKYRAEIRENQVGGCLRRVPPFCEQHFMLYNGSLPDVTTSAVRVHTGSRGHAG